MHVTQQVYNIYYIYTLYWLVYITHLAILVHILNITSYTYYILWIMYCILLTLQFRSNAKYKIDSLLGCWAWCSNNSLNVKTGWVIFEVPAWVSCLSFPNHFLGNLDWTWEFPITRVSCSLPTCIYFSVFFGRLLLHEKIYCLENVQYIFTALKSVIKILI